MGGKDWMLMQTWPGVVCSNIISGGTRSTGRQTSHIYYVVSFAVTDKLQVHIPLPSPPDSIPKRPPQNSLHNQITMNLHTPIVICIKTLPEHPVQLLANYTSANEVIEHDTRRSIIGASDIESFDDIGSA